MKPDIYSELLDIERRNSMFDKYYRTSVATIIEYLKQNPTIYLWDENFSVRVAETVPDDNCRTEYLDYSLSVDRIRYRTEKSFVMEGEYRSIAVHIDERMGSPRVIWFDILRLLWLIRYAKRAMNRERLPTDEVEEEILATIFKDKDSQREALKDTAAMKRLVLERMLTNK